MSDYTQETGRFGFTKDNGMVIGPDECSYDSEAEAMYYGQLKMCGCGNPEEVHKLVIDCMGAFHEKHETIIDLDKVAEVIKANPIAAAQFLMHVLDNHHLVEHGGSVYGSWLTGRGKQFVEAGVINEG